MKSIKHNTIKLTLFISALGLFSIGINQHTGITGKDEYYLALRTPLCMQEQAVWLIPCLDGEPRLRKPPMLYWLTRANFEIFGTSLTAARLVAVTFAASLVLIITLLSLELGDNWQTAIRSGLLALSCLGLAIGGRILEHDVPVATLSAAALLWFIRWYKRERFRYALLSSLCIITGFLTKGPVVFVVFGAGIAALAITDVSMYAWLQRNWYKIFSLTLFAVAITMSWFVYVYTQYPQTSTNMLLHELQDRRFPHLSLTPIFGIFLLSTPWNLIAIQTIWQHLVKKITNTRSHTYIIWLGLTLLPFFFIRSFERYLFGSLIPLLLLLAMPNNINYKISARLGLMLILPVILLIQIAALAIAGMSVSLGINFLTMIWYTFHWWQTRNITHMAISAAILWTITLGVTYPQLGINQVPPQLISQLRNQEIVLFNGPQPAFLPILLKRSLIHIDGHWRLPSRLLQPCSEFWLLSEDFNTISVLQGLKQLNFIATQNKKFSVFSSRVTWANMFRPGTTWIEAWNAIRAGKLETVIPQVVLYKARNSQCSPP